MNTTQRFTAHFLGLQERPNKPPMPLVNVLQTTAMYRPACHILDEKSKMEFQNILSTDQRLQCLFRHLITHWKTFGNENTEYLQKFFRISQSEILNWFDILLEFNLITYQEKCQF